MQESFFEEIITVWKIVFFFFFVIGLCPSLCNSPFHVLISILIHFFHHIHDSSLWILLFLLFFRRCSELSKLKYTFSYLKGSWAQDLLSFFVSVIVIELFLCTNLQSFGTISPQNFLIAKIKFCFLYPLNFISTDQLSNLTSIWSFGTYAPTPSNEKIILTRLSCT